MNVHEEWMALGNGYPDEHGDRRPVLHVGRATRAVFDVLAPWSGQCRAPEYELGHEETPTPQEVWELSERIATAVLVEIDEL